jgi:hypothetical protein
MTPELTSTEEIGASVGTYVSRTNPLFRRGIAVTLCVGLLWLFGALASQAGAVTSHPFEFEFSTGPGKCEAKSIAVDESAGAIWVLCDGITSYNEDQISIRKFHLDGSPFTLTATGPYLSGNVITGTPDPSVSSPKEGDYYFGCPCDIAVDNSNGPHKGSLYVTNEWGTALFRGATDVFEPSGKWIASIPQPGFATFVDSVDIGLDGTPYISSGGIDRYDSAYNLREQIYPGGENLAVDSTGAVYISRGGAVYKFEEDQFGKNLHTTFEQKFEDEVPAQPSRSSPHTKSACPSAKENSRTPPG